MDLQPDALTLLKKRFPDYEFRKTESRGDFDGQEHTIDVFGVPVAERKQFMKDARNIRGEIKRRFGHPGQFIFRTRGRLSGSQSS